MPTKVEPMSAKEAAKELGTDARTLRKFLRKKNGLVGQGQRWSIDPKELKGLKKEFDAWNKGSATKTEKKIEPEADIEEIDDNDDLEEVEDIDDLDDLDDLEDEDL